MTDPYHAPKSPAYWRWMAIFGVLFLASLALWIVMSAERRTPVAGVADDPRVALGVTLLTALISLAGFISTTWLAWRKEQRETATAAVQLERQRLEIERLRLELEKANTKRGEVGQG